MASPEVLGSLHWSVGFGTEVLGHLAKGRCPASFVHANLLEQEHFEMAGVSLLQSAKHREQQILAIVSDHRSPLTKPMWCVKFPLTRLPQIQTERLPLSRARVQETASFLAASWPVLGNSSTLL